MAKQIKPIHFIGIIVVIFIIFALIWARGNSNTKSLHSAANWLIEYKKELRDPGIIWIISSINKKYCGDSPEINTLVAERSSEFANDPILSLYEPAMIDSSALENGLPDLKNYSASFDDIILPSLYCNRYVVPENAREKIFDFSLDIEYSLTHKFLAMLLLKERGCTTKEEDLLIEKLASLVAKEQESEAMGDLFAERTAFLLYGGFENLVELSWIDTIVKNQKTSGGWDAGKYNYYFGPTENPHTTALSVLALSESERICPFDWIQ